MKPAVPLVALFIAACTGSSAEPADESITQLPLGADSCALARPDFGEPATAADRNLFAYDVNAPLNLQKTTTSENNDVDVSSISFDSPGGGRVTGMMWNPATRSSLRPGIVLMHGMPGTASNMAGLGQLYAQYGAVVIAIDAPFARRGGSPVQFNAQDRAEQIQLIKDLQRAVDVLRAQPNVDDDRIAYAGVSYGGAMGALFVGIERRLKTAVLVVGDGGLVSHFTGAEDAGFMASMSCSTRVGWFRSMAPIEPIRFIAHANAPLLLQSGTLDDLVPSVDASALHAAAPQSRTIRWYQAGHGLNLQASYDRHDWLHEKIGLDARQ
jgi:uncharacterized protein